MAHSLRVEFQEYLPTYPLNLMVLKIDYGFMLTIDNFFRTVLYILVPIDCIVPLINFNVYILMKPSVKTFRVWFIIIGCERQIISEESEFTESYRTLLVTITKVLQLSALTYNLLGTSKFPCLFSLFSKESTLSLNLKIN